MSASDASLWAGEAVLTNDKKVFFEGEGVSKSRKTTRVVLRRRLPRGSRKEKVGAVLLKWNGAATVSASMKKSKRRLRGKGGGRVSRAKITRIAGEVSVEYEGRVGAASLISFKANTADLETVCSSIATREMGTAGFKVGDRVKKKKQ